MQTRLFTAPFPITAQGLTALHRDLPSATYAIAPRTGPVVDMDHATDYPDVSQDQHGRFELGKGLTIARGANVNPVVFDILTAAARTEGIPCQASVFAAATPTDADAVQVSGARVATGLMGVPPPYVHIPSETLSLADVENCARPVAASCRRITPDTNLVPGSSPA